MPNKRLTRHSKDAILGGVCAGLARYFGWSANNMRLLYILLSALSAAFPGILVYILLWLFMPKR